MRQHLRVLSLCIVAGLTAQKGAATAVSVEIPVPATGYAGQPALSRGGDGSIRLSWVETASDGKQTTLRTATLGTREWSEPVTLAEGQNWFVNWADIPRVSSAADGRLLYGWLEDLGEEKYAYGVRIGIADVKAQLRSEPRWLHDDESPTEHGFLSLQPVGVDRCWALWLDGRRMADGVDAFEQPLKANHEMQVRAALLSSTGEKLREHVLDTRCCECCPTSLAALGEQVFAVWRDRSPDEIRNIAIARWDGSHWSEPRAVHDDAWKVPGCPVNGPSIAAQNERLAVAWFTAAGEEPQMRLAFGSASDLQFAAPIVFDRGKAMGRVDLELDDAGNAQVLWLSTLDPAHAAILWTSITPSGEIQAPETVTTLEASRAIGLPQFVLVDGAAIVVWTEGDANRSRIRCLQLRRGGEG